MHFQISYLSEYRRSAAWRKQKMGPTRLLTNIIQRKVMLPEEMSPSMQRDNFEVALTDFEKHAIIKCLFKADNQRSTECWSVREIANFIGRLHRRSKYQFMYLVLERYTRQHLYYRWGASSFEYLCVGQEIFCR